jgi:hypothetical protein
MKIENFFFSIFDFVRFLKKVPLKPLRGYESNQNVYTVHLRTNLDRSNMEHRWKQHKKRNAHKKISFKNVTSHQMK